MQGHGLIIRSSSIANIANPMDPRAASKQRKKYTKEVRVQKQLVRSTRKREENLEKKINKQGKVLALLK